MTLWNSVCATPIVHASVVPTSDDKPISVISDDERDAYVGTGGLLLPSTFTGSGEQRKSVAQCLGCRWTYRLQCATDLHDMCMQAAISCPATTIRYEVWFQRMNSVATQIGTVCWGKTKPPTRTSITRELTQRGLQYVPALRPGVLPHRESIQGLTNYFWTSQPSVYQSRAMDLLGQSVRITAQPIWRWVWGDGSGNWMRSPGADSQSSTISHRYAESGRYRITVTARWKATFTIESFGTFEVVGPDIRQTSALWLHVHGRHVALSGT